MVAESSLFALLRGPELELLAALPEPVLAQVPLREPVREWAQAQVWVSAEVASGRCSALSLSSSQLGLGC